MNERGPFEHGDGGGHGPLDVSRRGFLKGAAALAAAPVLAPGSLRADEPASDGLTRRGPGEVECSFEINGQRRSVSIEPRLTMLEVLRDKLDLTGAKEVCARGACGGCTIEVDGAAINSCMMLAMDAVGRSIRTVEGLAKGETLDPVQAAFVRHDGLQCGYCTPGFVMSVRNLLDRNPKPTELDVRQACAGNICRCGTYTKVFEAALAAAGVDVPVGNVADNAKKAIENNAGRVDAAQKVTGRAKYTADVNLPRMAWADIVSCPYGHARLKSFNADAARKIKGVLDVDIRKRKEYVYCGQPTGHVCAETRQALDDAIAALNLEWEILEPVVDPVAEHEKEHGPINEQIKNARAPRGGMFSGGDGVKKAKQAFKDAKHVVERTYTTQIQTHSSLEPHCAVADYRGDSAEFWCSTQGTATIIDGAVGLFGLDRNKVTAHCEYVGGGFGSKFGIGLEGRVAAELSKKLSRPVKMVNSRKREHLDAGCRPGSIQYMKMAADADGKPIGGHVHVVGVGRDGGGDTSNPSRYNFGDMVKSFVDIELSCGGARAMRAPGNPQGMFAVDSMVDELAAAAGVDPIEYRKRIDPNDERKKMYDVGAERIGWSKRPKPDGSGSGSRRRGIGVGVADWGNGPGGSQIRVDVFRDGTVRIVSGTQDIGTGTRTVLADILADQLKIERRLISADCGNSDYPPGPPSGGSVTARTIATAIRDAGDKAREELKSNSNLEYHDTASWIAACKKISGESFTVTGKANQKYWGKGGSEAVQFAEVEVDVDSGEVRVLKVVALQACGLPVNRLTVESQVIGGVIQGVSFALHEEKILDPTTGAMVNPNLEMYKILGPVDCPEIIPIIWRTGEDLGVRAIGEPPVVPTAGAVANAIANAIGVRVRSLPITPAKVLAALAEKGGAA